MLYIIDIREGKDLLGPIWLTFSPSLLLLSLSFSPSLSSLSPSSSLIIQLCLTPVCSEHCSLATGAFHMFLTTTPGSLNSIPCKCKKLSYWEISLKPLFQTSMILKRCPSGQKGLRIGYIYFFLLLLIYKFLSTLNYPFL